MRLYTHIKNLTFRTAFWTGLCYKGQSQDRNADCPMPLQFGVTAVVGKMIFQPLGTKVPDSLKRALS